MTARKFTMKEEGFDIIVEVGGADTMSHSLKAIKFEGVITVIGLVTGFYPPDNIMEALSRVCTFRGIHVGSRVQMEEMMAGIEVNGIQPVVDKRIFALEELKDGLEYLVSSSSLLQISGIESLTNSQKAQKHVGKIVIKVV